MGWSVGLQLDYLAKYKFSLTYSDFMTRYKNVGTAANPTLIGNGPEALKHVSMVGNDLRLDEGIGTCGKDGQAVPVGVGMPTTKLDRMTVGGTARKDPGGFMQ